MQGFACAHSCRHLSGSGTPLVSPQTATSTPSSADGPPSSSTAELRLGCLLKACKPRNISPPETASATGRGHAGNHGFHDSRAARTQLQLPDLRHLRTVYVPNVLYGLGEGLVCSRHFPAEDINAKPITLDSVLISSCRGSPASSQDTCRHPWT